LLHSHFMGSQSIMLGLPVLAGMQLLQEGQVHL
jgi:hypothetical protein